MPGKFDPHAVLMGKRLELVRKSLKQTFPEFKSKRAFAVALVDEGEVTQKEDRLRKWITGENALPHKYIAVLRERWGVSTEYMISRDPKRLVPEFFAVPTTWTG